MLSFWLEKSGQWLAMYIWYHFYIYSFVSTKDLIFWLILVDNCNERKKNSADIFKKKKKKKLNVIPCVVGSHCD